jgi:hypothetical protein
MLVMVLHEDAALPVNAAVGSVDEIVCGVMGVGRVGSLE